MKKSLLSTITEMAEMSFDLPMSSKEDIRQNFSAWLDHWFKTADNWRNELEAEGLINTVNKIDEEIEIFWQRNVLRTLYCV